MAIFTGAILALAGVYILKNASELYNMKKHKNTEVCHEIKTVARIKTFGGSIFTIGFMLIFLDILK